MFLYLFQKYNFFFIYVVIGLLSISLEILIRYSLLLLNFNELSKYLPILIGIIFCFFLNIYINFKIPKKIIIKSFAIFTIVSILSIFLQFILNDYFKIFNFNYSLNRIISASMLFFFSFYFHIILSFKSQIKSGVAIYPNNINLIDEKYNLVGGAPDFIHIDIIDKTFNNNAIESNLEYVELIRNKWNFHKFHVHIMSTNINYWINKIVKKNDIVFFHENRNQETNKIINLINKKKATPGISIKYDEDINENLISKFKEVLILCIKTPGESGQKFQSQSLEKIDILNNLKFRKKFKLSIDGGVNYKILKDLNCDNLISASYVFRGKNPIKNIINLRKYKVN